VIPGALAPGTMVIYKAELNYLGNVSGTPLL
jgi:hypothetical protein